MEKLMVEMKIIADRMVHHVAKAFFNFQVFLSAVMTKMTLQNSSAIKAIVVMSVMLFHNRNYINIPAMVADK